MTAYTPQILQVLSCSAYFGLVAIHIDHQRDHTKQFLHENVGERLTAFAYSILAVAKSAPLIL